MRRVLQVSASLKELRERIGSVKNTKKITDAMKLVAAAKVRRAQAAVLGARPFSENLVKVLYAVNSKLQGEDVDVPLTAVRPVKSVRAQPGRSRRLAPKPGARRARRARLTRVSTLTESWPRCAAPGRPLAPRRRARAAKAAGRTAARRRCGRRPLGRPFWRRTLFGLP